MHDKAREFVPTISPEKMRDDPWCAREILAEVLDWLRANTAGLSEDDQRDLARAVGVRAGLYAAEYPVDLGGWAIPERVVAQLREDAGASGMWFSRFILSNFHGPSRVLMDATKEQREKYLRPLVEGRWTRCLAMTEETGGSDLSLMRTTATRRADGTWTLSGRKFMIGNAADADVAVVLARAEGACEGGPTFFVFPTTTPGWRVGQRLHGMDPGYRAYEVDLDAIELTDDDIVGGPAEIGGAIGQVTEHMAYGRIAMAARAVGLAAFALDTARGYADRRISAGGKLSEKQYVREFIVSSDVKVEAARALVRQAADALDEGRVAARDAAIAKLFATESACEVVDAAIQTLGARGWLTEYGLERVYREVRGFRIADGASEVLKETIFFLPPTAPFRVG